MSQFLLELLGFDVQEKWSIILSLETWDTALRYVTMVVLMGCNSHAGSCGRREPMVQDDWDVHRGRGMLI